MKSHKKLIPGLVLILILLVTGCVFADDDYDEYVDFVYVNPLYNDYYTEQDVIDDWVAPIMSFGVGDQEEGVYESINDLVDHLRRGLSSHSAEISFYYLSNEVIELNTLWTEVMDSAKAHTGVPNEGDYISYNLMGSKGAMGRLGSNVDGYIYRYKLIFRPTYMHDMAQEIEATNAFNAAYAAIQPDGESDVARAWAAYNYVIDNVSYDYDNLNDDSYTMKYSSYAAIIHHTAVCQGYSSMLYRILLMYGIDNRIVTSSSHGWNIVNIDGEYYQVDATWGDSSSATTRKNYFLRKSGAFSDSAHKIESKFTTGLFGETYPISSGDYTAVTSVNIVDQNGKDYAASVEKDFLDESLTLYANVKPNTAKQSVIWTTSGPDIVELNPSDDGLTCVVEFTGAGEVEIIAQASADTDKSDSVKLTIAPSVMAESIELLELSGDLLADPYTVDMVQNRTLEVTSKVLPAKAAQKVSWESSDPYIATIESLDDLTATIKLRHPGDVTITATSMDGAEISQSFTLTLVSNYGVDIVFPNEVRSGDETEFSIQVSPDPWKVKRLTWGVNPEYAGTFTQEGTFIPTNTDSILKAELYAMVSIDGNEVMGYKDIVIVPRVSYIAIQDEYGMRLSVSRIGVGETRYFSALVLPEDAKQDVVWRSSDPSVLSVDENGTVKGLKAGDVRLFAEATDGGELFGEIYLKVINRVTGITLTGPEGESSGELKSFAGGSFQLSSVLTPSNASIAQLSYSVSGPAIVHDDGTVIISSDVHERTPLTITAEAIDGSGVKASYTAYALPIAETVSVYDESGAEMDSAQTLMMDILEKNTMQFTLTCAPDDADPDILWSVDGDGASISEGGLLTVSKTGNYTVSAKTLDGSELTVAFPLIAYIDADSLTLSGPGEIHYNKPVTTTLSSQPAGVQAADLNWTVYEDGCAAKSTTVTDGVVVSTAPHGTVIKVVATQKYGDTSVSGSYEMVFILIADQIDLNADVLDIFDMANGTEYKISASITPALASQKVTWKSSDTSVATVDDEGNLTLLKVGSTTITATTTDGTNLSVSKKITVICHVNNIVIDAPDKIAVGKTGVVSAAVYPTAATNKTLTWGLTVDGEASKLVTLKSGKVSVNSKTPLNSVITVTASASDGSGVVGSANIIVSVAAQTVTVTDSDGNAMAKSVNVNLNNSKEISLGATILPAEAGQKVTWKTSSAAVATVDANGIVTFNKAGTVTITATAADGSGKTGTVKLVGVVEIDSINITSMKELEIALKKTSTVTYGFDQELQPTVKTVVWSSSDPSIASVSAKGVITGVAAGGPVTVSVCSANNTAICDSVSVKVMPEVAKTVTVTYANGDALAKTTNVNVSGSSNEISLGASILPEGASQKVTWKTSSAAVATVDANGKVTFNKAGSVTITATAADGSNKTGPIKLVGVVMIDSINITSLKEFELGLKKTSTVTYAFDQEIQPTLKTVVWSSSNPSIASVSTKGVITGTAAGGPVTVTVCSANDATICDSVSVTVMSDVVKTLTLVDDVKTKTIDLASGTNTYQLGYSILPATASQIVTWTSSNTAVATVDQNGLVTGLQAGSANITVAAQDGSKKTAKIALSVTSKVQPGALVVEGPGEVVVKNTITLVPVFNQNPLPTVQTVTYKSSNTKIASVSTKGVVKGVKEGEAVITVTSKDNTSIFVEVPIKVVTTASAASVSMAQPFVAESSEIPSVEVKTVDTEVVPAETVTLLSEDITADEVIETAGEEPVIELVPEETIIEGSPEEEAVKIASVEGPRFASQEQVLMIGESLILDILNPGEEAIIVGLSGDTDAVLWNEEYRMITPIGEAELTAYLASVDPIEIKDMMAIHIVAELPGEEAVEAAETVEGEETVEATEPVEGEEVTDEVIEETPAEEQPTEESITEEVTEPTEDEAETELEATEERVAEGTAEPVDETPATEPLSEEVPAESEAEKPEIIITDLGEYDTLEGVEATAVYIERERFELDDELMRGLIFEVEDEAVAKLTEHTADEIAADGIELSLLAAGETKLMIRREGDTEPLREIRIVVSVAPVVEESGLEAEPAAEEAQPVAAEPVPEEAPAEDPVPVVGPVEEASSEAESEAKPEPEPESIEEPAPEPESVVADVTAETDAE